jgi:hypothetical protein
MSRALPRIVHRLAALALLLVALTAVAALIVRPVIGYALTLAADITAQRDLIGRLEAFAAGKEAAQTRADHARAATRAGLFLPGETDALRTANLQAAVTEIAEKAKVRLASTRALPGQEQDGLTLIGVQTEFEADLKQLQAMIAAIEARRPFLFLQSLQIAPAASRRRDSDGLRIRLGVFGAVAPETVAEARP